MKDSTWKIKNPWQLKGILVECYKVTVLMEAHYGMFFATWNKVMFWYKVFN